MIDITKLDESYKGREVRYQTFGRIEYGWITSWNDKFVFVQYHTIVEDSATRSRTGTTSQATDPNDLEWSNPHIFPPIEVPQL